MTTHKTAWELAAVTAVFILALLLRLAHVFLIDHPPLQTDAFNYDVMARQFLEKGFLGYLSDIPNAVVTPGYPLFLSLIYFLSGVSGLSDISPLLYVRIIQSVIGALTCVSVYYAAKHMKNRKTALFASFLCAVYPSFAWSSTLILTETLFNFLFLTYFIIQIEALKKKSAVLSILGGCTFAIAVLVRPLIFPLLLLPFIYEYYTVKKKLRYKALDKAPDKVPDGAPDTAPNKSPDEAPDKSPDKQEEGKVVRSGRGFPTPIRLLLLTIAGAVAVMLPWWIRNAVTLGSFIPLATQTGNPLIAGAFPYYSADLSKFNVEDPFAAGLRYIWDGFRSQPFYYIKWFTIGKFNYLFEYMWYDAPYEFTLLRSIKLVHGFTVSLGWLGVLYFTINTNSKLKLAALFAIILTAMQLLFVPENRYAYSIMPFLIILASGMLDEIFFRLPSYTCRQSNLRNNSQV